MSSFKYKAKKITGEETEGVREARDRFDLAKLLRKEGYILVDYEEEKQKSSFDLSFLKFLGRVSLSEKMIFTRNLAVMIGAGLPISRALKVLIRQAKNNQFKEILSQISSSLTEGKALSDSMAEHPKVFSKLYLAMLKAGEKSGNMEESLKILAEQMNKDFLLRRRVKGAMIYPAIVIIAMIGIAILMLIYVVPTLISTFEEVGVDLPASTRLVIWFSKFLTNNFILSLGLFLIIGILAVWASRSATFKKITQKLLLRMPIFSGLIRKINSARTARTLSSLINSGVEILEALDVTSNVVQNIYYKNVLKEAQEEIRKGSTISSAFKKAEGIYPPLVAEMITVGEETGSLPEMLLRLAVFFEEEVAETTKDMATIIEPVLMIVIGAVVGFFAVSMMTPMYTMMGSL